MTTLCISSKLHESFGRDVFILEESVILSINYQYLLRSAAAPQDATIGQEKGPFGFGMNP